VSPTAKYLLVSGLLLCGLAVAPAARAETSYHKMKKRLHKLEHVTGEVVEGTGEILGWGLSGLDLEIDFESHKAASASSHHSEKSENRSEKEPRLKMKRE
jgi:hypothetical protein